MASSEQGYERLGAKLLSLPDVIAQSIGFIGPVFSSAFVIPLVVGVISASGKGGGVAAPLSVILAAVSKPMNSSTPYSMPKMMPGQPSAADDGLNGLRLFAEPSLMIT